MTAKPCLGMRGTFHTPWGDFHSIKNLSALEYECFLMLAMGAQCSVDDQLHPRGRRCPFTYGLIERRGQAEVVRPYLGSQDSQGRWVLHLLHNLPELRGHQMVRLPFG